jgi:hypothetical protein
MESSPPIPPFARAADPSQADPWQHAIRVAFVTSLTAAAVGVVLYRLVGLSAWVILPLLVFGGWVVGCHLSPAAPATRRPGPGGTGLHLVEDSFGDPADESEHRAGGEPWSGGLAA